MSIKPLPEDVVARIKSSTVITSINAVACGLLQNALDAKALKVNIVVDYRRGNCSVEDDGCGILPSEFAIQGGLGKLHYTSKHPHHPDVHGRHGTFLASVAALSLLTVTSRHHKHHSCNFLSVHNSKDLARHIPALPEQRLLTLSHGTRVTVRDLFGSMPVRVKQRAMEAEGSGHSKDWDSLIRHVLALLLACNRDVSVTIKDPASNESVTLRATDSLASRRTSKGDKPANLIPRSTRLFSQASLCDLDDIESWVSVGITAPRYSVNGAVSLNPAATKRAQFISLGIQPILNDYHSNVLYEEINKVFANSSFGVVEDGDDSETDGRAAKDNGFTGRELKAKKGIERWPMFYLRIITDQAQVGIKDVDDMLDDGRHGLPILIDLLKAVFHEFLRKHHFRPHTVRLGLGDTVGRSRSPMVSLSTEKSSSSDLGTGEQWQSRRPSKQRKLDPVRLPSRGSRATSSVASSPRHSAMERLRGRSGSPFAAWTRVKSASPGIGFTSSNGSKEDNKSMTPEQPAVDTKQEKGSKPKAPPLIAKDGQLLRRSFGNSRAWVDSEPPAVPVEPEKPAQERNQPDTFVWENPRSKTKSVIDSRTGFIVTPRPTPTPSDTSRDKRSEKEQRRARINAKPSGDPSAWTRDLLSSWKNPVFETAQTSIPRLPEVVDAPKVDANPAASGCGGCHLMKLPQADELSTSSAESKISKDDLSNSEVIGQVDQKFILAKVPVTPAMNESGTGDMSHLLVLIDQHAADERCRVESMMADFFQKDDDDGTGGRWTAQASILDKPLHFDLSKRERKLLERFQPYFQHWGVFYEVAPPDRGKQSSNDTGVTVWKLPPSIMERCRLEPKLLADLIRKEIWKLEESGGAVPQRLTEPPPGEASLSWAARFHGCPQGILDMINSRACRSAIMFNDVLSVPQCRDLIGRLVQCAFPFQCAHGRPSMVPILDLGSSDVP